MLGRKFSMEHRERMSEAAKRRANTPEFKVIAARTGKANLGMRRTEEQRQRIAESHRGLRRTDETKQKMSEARKKWWEQRKAASS
jgi:NUMOD3 motif